ncbi:MAG TPA: acyltransferase, partial [Streptomyces sp.]|uniref:acyltransferase family protein n=1 Tax=Streptomyces sp. TaxID=1931 RepID=UPI002BF1F850
MSPTQEARPALLPSLTGMRAIGVLFVFITHGLALGAFSDPQAVERYNTLIGGGRMGYLAVSFFFVLSGFILTWTAGPRDTARGFWRRRLMRIGPSHLVIAGIVLVMFLAAGERIRIVPAVANLFLVQNWVPDPDLIFYQLNGPTWTLSVELLCYALFPVLLPLIRRIDPGRLWLWLGALAVTAVLIPLISYPLLSGYPPSTVFTDGSWPQQWLLYFFPPVRSLDFVIGMFLARIIATGRWPRIRVLPAFALNLAVYLLLYHLPTPFGFAALYPLPMALLIGAVASSDLAGRTSVMSSRPVVWLGELSFSFYVLHVTVIFAVHAAFAGELSRYAHQYTRVQFGTPTAIALLTGLYILCVA